MSLLTVFWILIGISFVILAIIQFGVKTDLLTPIFWLLFGISLILLMVVLWYGFRGS